MTSHHIEVSRLQNGIKAEVRRLSARGEQLAGLAVLALCVAAGGASLVVANLAMRMTGRVVFAPKLLLFAGIAGAVATSWLMRAAKSRARHVKLGPKMTDDGFAPVAVDLVRRLPSSGDVFELGIVAGMSGQIQSERMIVPVEALAPSSGARPVYRRLEPGDGAVVSLGAETYLVERKADVDPVSFPSLRRAVGNLPKRWAVIGLGATIAVAFYASVPAGHAVTQLKPPLVSERKASGWEAELELRMEAQLQAASLHQCFDKLPLACQRPGYVGVGLSLTREGEIRSHWIASSTYNEACPVTACMGEIVALWQFNPLPQPMRVVLPVQVLRTGKPLVPDVKRASASIEHARAVLASMP